MNPQITPFGVILASPFWLLSLFLLWRLWRRLKTSTLRWSVPALLLIVLMLPFADEFWIAWNFEQLCRESGVKVYRTVEVEGYLNTTASGSRKPIIVTSTASIAEYERSGFRFQERIAEGNKISHAEKTDGQWQVVILDKPEARYHYLNPNQKDWVPVGYQINRHERRVVDSLTNEVLGRELSYERYPGFVEGLWIRFIGSGQIICNRPLDDMERKTLTGAAYAHVLNPKKSN